MILTKTKCRLKKRNLCLLIIGFLLLICLLIDLFYFEWLNTGGPLNSLEMSDEVKMCLKKHHSFLKDCLYFLDDKENDLKQDEFANLHYVGASPNNYLDLGEKYDKVIYRGTSKDDNTIYKDFLDMTSCLNENLICRIVHNEGDAILWRIVGVFNINDESLVKVVRDESIGEYSWDSSAEEINGGYGVNEWSESDLYNLLNNQGYNNKTISSCMIDKNNQEKECDFTTLGLSEVAKDKAYQTMWATAALDEDLFNQGLIGDWANKEKGESLKICEENPLCNDLVSRTNQTEAYIGLLTPSDYGYATSLDSCYTIPFKTWNNNENSQCYQDNWLMNNSGRTWLLNPLSFTTSAAYGLTYQKSGGFSETFASVAANIYPSMYLKPTLKIKEGFGTKEKPYVLK